ncbi:MAG: PilZ domain-containing protein [Butyricicoccus sp.]|nr:PilZ domain-containing protein [Butyricicoccus sp.]
MAFDQKTYLLLDSDGAAIAQAKIEGRTDTPNWQLRVLDDKIDEVTEYESVRLMSITDSAPSYEGNIVRSRNDMVQLVVRKLAPAFSDKRKNLRVPVKFTSYIYPVTGRWSGRRKILSSDISCGGIAFFSPDTLFEGEVIEVVVPVTSQPLIVRCQLLRQVPIEGGVTMYAGKFVNMCDDEEVLLRESVFSLQLSMHPRRHKSAK